MDVELRQLRCLVAIVDEGTFTDAAIGLGVSQAAVSRNLASLERALEVRLLRRTSRSVTPTATGLRVVAQARRVLGEVDDLVREATSGHTSLPAPLGPRPPRDRPAPSSRQLRPRRTGGRGLRPLGGAPAAGRPPVRR